MVDVRIINNYNYMYLSENNRAFGMHFEATRQQAESFELKKLLINQEDRTQEFEHLIEHHPERGQLTYVVKTKKNVPIDKVPCNIYTEISYQCPPLEFFQSYRLPYPCRKRQIFLRISRSSSFAYNCSR